MAPSPVRSWVCRLAPVEASAAEVPASHAPLLVEATEVLGPRAVAWAVDLGARMAGEIIDQVPELGGSDEAAETLRMGTESATLFALMVLATDDHTMARLTEEGLEGDRDFVRRGIRIDRVLAGVRIGHGRMTRELLDAVTVLVDEDRRVEEMTRTSELLFRFIDVYSSSMAEEYLAEHDRWVTSAAAERAELVRRLIDGHTPPPDASRVLGYRLDRQHLAMVMWTPVGQEHSPALLQRASARLLHDLGCTASLEVPHGTGSLWVWGSWRSRAAAAAAPVIVEAAEGVHVAVGTVSNGPAGFRDSHLEAARVVELVRSHSPSRASGLVRYHDVELAVLLAQDLDGARTFLRRELGDVASPTPASAELRDTVAAYLRHDRSLVKAGDELHIARNTVAYRVKKFEEITGRSVGERRLELEAALRLAAFLGPRVLGADAEGR